MIHKINKGWLNLIQCHDWTGRPIYIIKKRQQKETFQPSNQSQLHHYDSHSVKPIPSKKQIGQNITDKKEGKSIY